MNIKPGHTTTLISAVTDILDTMKNVIQRYLSDDPSTASYDTTEFKRVMALLAEHKTNDIPEFFKEGGLFYLKSGLPTRPLSLDVWKSRFNYLRIMFKSTDLTNKNVLSVSYQLFFDSMMSALKDSGILLNKITLSDLDDMFSEFKIVFQYTFLMQLKSFYIEPTVKPVSSLNTEDPIISSIFLEPDAIQSPDTSPFANDSDEDVDDLGVLIQKTILKPAEFDDASDDNDDFAIFTDVSMQSNLDENYACGEKNLYEDELDKIGLSVDYELPTADSSPYRPLSGMNSIRSTPRFFSPETTQPFPLRVYSGLILGGGSD